MFFKGIGASNGIAIARAYKYEEPELIVSPVGLGHTVEIKKYEGALEVTLKQLDRIKELTEKNLDEEHAQIFEAHKLVLKDPELTKAVVEKVHRDDVSAAHALKETSDMFVMMFESMDNEYMRERATDIKDVTKRLLTNLLGLRPNDLSTIDEEVIIIADDLTPSDTAQLNKKYVKGFITRIGGRTSHSAIMARSLEIPAIVGVTDILESVIDGDSLILDGIDGEVFVHPKEDLVIEYQKKSADYTRQKIEWAKLKDEKTVTGDGHHVELAANIGSVSDLEGVLENGAEGIGLFRTEFLYMGRNDFPTEEEQYETYKEVLSRMEGKPVVVRTLDIGGDKELPYLEMEEEMNPFLGYRAIRLCLDQTDLFRTQLRALLRASVHGNLKVMFPMIATIDEFLEAKGLLLDVKKELLEESIAVSETIEVGMMVEIPSAAVLADQFAKVVDFFSIGTNDLIQYSFAADRMNKKVAYLYQPYNPSLIRLIKMVIDAAHANGIWAGMCGEVAGDSYAIPYLLGLELDEFSMSATSILQNRSLIKTLKKEKMEELSRQVLGARTNHEVLEIIKEYVEENEK